MNDKESAKLRIEATEENPFKVIMAKSVVVATFNPEDSGSESPSAVHLYAYIEGSDEPVAIVFNHPRQLTAVLRELSSAGKAVWPVKREGGKSRLFTANKLVA